jgi:hypothetical protein
MIVVNTRTRNLVEGVGNEPSVAIVGVQAVEAVVFLVRGSGSAAKHARDGAGGACATSQTKDKTQTSIRQRCWNLLTRGSDKKICGRNRLDVRNNSMM